MTKAETKILNYVKFANDRNALAGVAESKFLSRLENKGEIVYVKTDVRGSGWAVIGHPIVEGDVKSYRA